MMIDFKYVLRMLGVRAIFSNPKLIFADELVALGGHNTRDSSRFDAGAAVRVIG